MYLSIFFFNDTATTEIYTLSLHDALPICRGHADMLGGEREQRVLDAVVGQDHQRPLGAQTLRDRKSTRLNSSHANISYAVFCLKKKTNKFFTTTTYVPSHKPYTLLHSLSI